MTLEARYLVSTKNVGGILSKMREGVAPEVFNSDHLKAIGFGGSNDRAFVPLLKDLGFLDTHGKPTERYLAYRNPSQSRAILGEALREKYSDVFTLNQDPTKLSRQDLKGLFKQRLNSSDRVSEAQALTFETLLSNADVDPTVAPALPLPEPPPPPPSAESSERKPRRTSAELHYTIQVHLPATKDIEVYNAIFGSLRSHLLDS